MLDLNMHDLGLDFYANSGYKWLGASVIMFFVGQMDEVLNSFLGSKSGVRFPPGALRYSSTNLPLSRHPKHSRIVVISYGFTPSYAVLLQHPMGTLLTKGTQGRLADLAVAPPYRLVGNW
jgi:hypothetical protein